jgi:hypothetical protein
MATKKSVAHESNGVNRLASPAEKKFQRIEIDDWHGLSTGELILDLESTMPMLQNNFPARIKQQILDKQAGKKSVKKEPKDVELCFLEALIVIGPRPGKDDIANGTLGKFRYAMPAVMFKESAVTAASQYDDLFKIDARTSFWIITEPGDANMVPLILDGPPYPQQDVARQKGTVDIRIRPRFDHWKVRLRIGFNARKVSKDQLFGWFLNAGRSIGVGDWRLTGKSSSGMYGGFRITGGEVFTPEMA